MRIQRGTILATTCAEAFPLEGETVPSMGYVLFGPNGAVKHIMSFK